MFRSEELNMTGVGQNDEKRMVDKNYKEYKGYKSLAIFKQAEIIHDFTVEFVKLYVDCKSRTRDQMEQAARSGKQNIPEGYLQKKLESRLDLLSVARGSLEELLNDYLDFLRQRGFPIWEKEDPRAKAVRALVYKDYKSYNDYKSYMASPENAANCMVCLINQTNELLDNKIRWTREEIVKTGGSREKLWEQRKEYKRQNYKSEQDIRDEKFDQWLIDHMKSQGYKRLENGQYVKDTPSSS